MKIRKTEVCWDAGLIRVEYLDAEGIPYYCEFEERANLPENVPSENATCPARLSESAIPAPAEPITPATETFPARPNQE
jgi:hypothetical protein